MKLLVSLIAATSLFLMFATVTPVEAARSYGIRSYRTPSFKAPSIRNYSRGGSLKLQSGYLKRNGTYVQPHLKTSPDNTIYNNRKYQLGY